MDEYKNRFILKIIIFGFLFYMLNHPKNSKIIIKNISKLSSIDNNYILTLTFMISFLIINLIL